MVVGKVRAGTTSQQSSRIYSHVKNRVDGGRLGSCVCLDFFFSRKAAMERELLNTREVSRVAPLRFFSGSLSPRRASLSPAAPKRAGEERALSSWPTTRHLAAFGTVRSWGCSFGFLRPSPSTFLPSLPRPLRPSLGSN